MAKNDGGTAFPCNSPDGMEAYSGMTVRQYYKAAALQGLLANGGIYPGQAVASNVPENMAHLVGMVADAMIAEDEEAAK